MYVFTLNNIRKRYTKTYAWQIENSSPQDNFNKNKLYITELRQNVFLFKSLKIVGIILALLISFRGPFLMISFMGMHGFEASHGTIVITGALLGLNSVINPFIYSLKIETLRKNSSCFLSTVPVMIHDKRMCYVAPNVRINQNIAKTRLEKTFK